MHLIHFLSFTALCVRSAEAGVRRSPQSDAPKLEELLVPNQDQVVFDYSFSGTYADVTGTRKSAHDIVWNVWNKRGESTVDPSPVDLGGGCSIAFRGGSDDSWRTMNAMAQILVAMAGDGQALSLRQDTGDKRCVLPCPKQAPQGPNDPCCAFEPVYRVRMPARVDVAATSSEGRLAALGYEITCGAAATPDCGTATGLTSALMAGLDVRALAGRELGHGDVASGGVVAIYGCEAPKKPIPRPLDRNPFVDGLVAIPESCAGFMQPADNEACHRDLAAQEGGVEAFGGGKLKWDPRSCTNEQRGAIETAAYDAATLAKYGAKAPTGGKGVLLWKTYIGPDFSSQQTRILGKLSQILIFLILLPSPPAPPFPRR
jgi:hypothetical protein